MIHASRSASFVPPRLARRLDVELDADERRLDALLAEATERSIARGIEFQAGHFAGLRARLRRRAVRKAVAS